jgi:hypothetical protein
MTNEQQLLENLISATVASDRHEPAPPETGQSEHNLMDEQDLRSYDLIKYRLDFAQRCFTNNQDLVRFLDQKTGLILSAVGLLTTAQGALMLRAFNVTPTLPWQIGLRVVISICVLTYMLIAFAVITAGVNVFAPSTKNSRRSPQAPGFLYPLEILSKHNADEDIYRGRLMSAMPSQLLHDLASQVIEIATVYRNKNHNLQKVTQRFRWLSKMWALNMLLLAISVLLS